MTLNRDTLMNMIVVARDKYLENAKVLTALGDQGGDGFITDKAAYQLADQFEAQALEADEYLELLNEEEEILL